MRTRFLMLGVLVLAVVLGWGRGADAEEYRGADGGYVVWSAGSRAIPMNFTFHYRGLAPAPGMRRAWAGTLGCGCVGMWGARRDFDYTGVENGKVTIQRLPPGEYEIHDFGFGGSVAGTITSFSSGRPFVIPFTVRSGQTTYIGGFARAVSLGTALEPTLGAAGYFVIADESARDLPIARAKMPDLPDVTIQVADVSAFGHPALRARPL